MKTFIFFLSLFFWITYSQAQESELLKNLKGHSIEINAVAFSPDGKLLASVAGNMQNRRSEFFLWDTESGKTLYAFDTGSDYLADICFHPDGSMVAVAGGFSQSVNLQLWDVPTRTLVRKFVGQEAVKSIAFSSDGKYLVSGGLDKTVRIWEVQSGQLVQTLSGHQYFVLDIEVSKDGKWIISSAGDYNKKVGEVKVWETKSGRLVQTIKGLPYPVNAIALCNNNQHLVTAGENGTLKIWDFEKGTEIRDLTEPYTNIETISISDDGKYLLTSGENRSIKLWDMESGEKIKTITGHLKAIHSVVFNQGANLFASAGKDLTIKIWKAVPVKRTVESYANKKMQEWMQRGKFEKTEDFQQRTGENNLQSQFERFVEEAFTKFYGDDLQWNRAKNYYDADNETFKIVLPDLQPFYLKVPYVEAKSFDENFQKLQFNNPVLTLVSEDQVAFKHLEVLNPANGKTYIYDSQESIAFNFDSEQNKKNAARFEIYQETTDTRDKNQNKQVFRTGRAEVDYDLPKTQMNNPDAIAVVIGNTHYKKVKTVDFAISDARSIRSYLMDVMGYKRENIVYLENASLTDFKMIFGEKGNHKGRLFNLIKPEISEVFVYYSGHGAPGLNDKKGYFVPVECDPQYVELTGYSIDVFYDNLAQLPAKNVTVVMDACFSGENIYQNISPIVIKSKGPMGLPNGAMLASSAADQVSTWYLEKGHGLFTYFFLKAVHNKNADQNKDNQLTLSEIYNFISDKTEGIPYFARRLHGIEQTPVLKGQNPDKVLVVY